MFLKGPALEFTFFTISTHIDEEGKMGFYRDTWYDFKDCNAYYEELKTDWLERMKLK